MATAEDVLKQFEQCGTVQRTALRTGISHSAVRRILLSQGIIATERTRLVHGLKEHGLTDAQICEKLEISMKALKGHMPHTKRSYVVGEKTAGAKRVAKCRERKKARDNNQKRDCDEV